MNNACKRLLSLFMAVAMVMSYVAVPVSAEDGDPQPPASCLGQAGVECTFDAHIEGCDKYEAPVTSCQGLAGVECTFDAHIEGCDKYEAPVTSCQGLAGVECTFDAHIEGCDKYVAPVTSCLGQAGVECAFDAHIEGCDKYEAPVTSCLGQAGVECAFDAHIEGCDKYEAPVTCNGTADCEAEAHNDGCAKAAADAAAKQVEEVEALIEELPTEEEVRAMDWNQLTALNTQITNISLKIDALGDHKSAVDSTGIAALAALLNERVMTLTETAVAKIGDTPYTTLAAALTNATAGQTITVNAGTYAMEPATYNLADNVTLSGIGEVILTFASSTDDTALTIKASGLTWDNVDIQAPSTYSALLFNGSGTFKNSSISGMRAVRNSNANGAVVFDNCALTATESYAVHFGGGSGTVEIKNGSSLTGWCSFAESLEKVTISDTEFKTGPYNQLRFYQDAEVTNCIFPTGMNIDSGDKGDGLADIDVVFTNCGNVTDYIAQSMKDVSNVTVDNELLGAKVKVSNGDAVRGYKTLEKAVEAAAEGDTITLLDDIELSETITVTGTVTLDLGSYTITGTPATAAAFAVIHNKGNLTITGSGAIVCDHKLEGSTDYAVNTIRNDGTLTINGPTIENKSTASNQIGYAIDNYAGSSATILSGEIKASGSSYYDGIRLFCSDSSGISVTVKGGKVSTIWMQNPSDENIEDVKGSITISDEGEVGKLYLEPSAVFTASITGGTVGSVSYNETAAGRNLTGFITGGYFTTDVSAFVPFGYKQEAVTGEVKAVDMKAETDAVAPAPVVSETLKNEATAEEKAVIDKVTANDNVNNATTVTDSIKNAVQEDTKVQEAIQTAVNNSATTDATDVQFTVKIELEDVDVDDTTGKTTLQFEVVPVVQPVKEVTVDGETKQVPIEGAAVEVKELDADKPITFRLPMPNGTAGRIVNITHKHNDTETFLGAYTIESTGETSTNCYVELASANFSDWVAEILPENVTDITAEVEGTPYATLQEALEHAKAGETIKLLKSLDISTVNGLNFNGIILDLNTKTLTMARESNTLTNSTIKNGTIEIVKEATDSVADGLFDTYGTVQVSDVVFHSDSSAIYAIFDIKTGTLTMDRCTIDMENNDPDGGLIYFNGGEKLTMNNCTVSGTNIGDFLTNGTAELNNCDISLKGTVEKGLDNGINGTALTLNNTTLTVDGATGRGLTSDGDTINIKGNSAVTLTNCAEASIRFKAKGEIKVENTAALLAESVLVDAAADSAIVANTVIDANADTPVAERPSITKEANKPQAQPAAAIIQIDGMYHTDMSTAIPAMEAEGPHEVKLLANVEGGFTVQNDTTVTLDLNGFSITGDTDAAAASSITVNGTLDVYDSQHTDTSAIKVPIIVNANGGQFALNKPAAVGALNSSGMAYIYGGTVNGAISTESAGLVEIWGGNILGEMAGQVRVKGEPNGKLNEAVFANDPTEFCEDGFYGEKRTDGKYTIAEKDHMIVNGLVKYDTNLGNVIDTTDGGTDSLLDIVLKKGDTTITGEHAVKNGLDLLLDTEENKVTGGGSVTSEQVMQIVSNEADTVLPDGGKITFHSDVITYAPRYLDQEGYGRIDFSDHNGRKCYYLDKGATLTVTHKGEVSVTGKYILGNARGPIYTISISQDGPYDNRHYLGKDGDMTVTCNGFYGSVEKIWITGEKLDGKVHVVFEKGAALSGFEVEEGSTVVTLSKKYLNSLEKGDYKIHFQYKDHDDGEYVSEVFKVRTKSSYEADPTNPKTGDTILLPMAVMLTSAAALFVLVMNKKKHA